MVTPRWNNESVVKRLTEGQEGVGVKAFSLEPIVPLYKLSRVEKVPPLPNVVMNSGYKMGRPHAAKKKWWKWMKIQTLTPLCSRGFSQEDGLSGLVGLLSNNHSSNALPSSSSSLLSKKYIRLYIYCFLQLQIIGNISLLLLLLLLQLQNKIIHLQSQSKKLRLRFKTEP